MEEQRLKLSSQSCGVTVTLSVRGNRDFWLRKFYFEIFLLGENLAQWRLKANSESHLQWDKKNQPWRITIEQHTTRDTRVSFASYNTLFDSHLSFLQQQQSDVDIFILSIAISIFSTLYFFSLSFFNSLHFKDYILFLFRFLRFLPVIDQNKFD